MKVKKRNGNIVLYDDKKMIASILNANSRSPLDMISERIAADIADEVIDRLAEKSSVISTKEIRECVYEVLCERGFHQTAKEYIEYVKSE